MKYCYLCKRRWIQCRTENFSHRIAIQKIRKETDGTDASGNSGKLEEGNTAQ